MNEKNRFARRYHWLGEIVENYVNEPHSAIASQGSGHTLNMVAAESGEARGVVARIASEEKPENTIAELRKIATLNLPARHDFGPADLHPDSLKRIILSAYESQPQGFEQLLGLPGGSAPRLSAP